jgi:broad specificity phosphatase PhoE
MEESMEGPVEVPEPPPKRAPGGLGAPFALGGVTVVRHGESTANVAFAEAIGTGATEPMPGSDAEVGLSLLGVRQAGALGRWFAGLGAADQPQMAICSTYRRARETWAVMARTAARLGAAVPPVLVDERLRDREMGVFELHPPPALRARDPRESARRELLGDWAYRPPGGESTADVALRVRDFLTELDRTLPGGRVLLVAHDAVVAGVRFVVEGVGAPVPDGLPPVPNASVSRWTGDGRRLHLTEWGGTGHLEREAPR